MSKWLVTLILLLEASALVLVGAPTIWEHEDNDNLVHALVAAAMLPRQKVIARRAASKTQIEINVTK